MTEPNRPAAVRWPPVYALVVVAALGVMGLLWWISATWNIPLAPR